MKTSLQPYFKTYDEYLNENRKKINVLMDRVLMVITLTGPLLYLAKLFGLFSGISYVNISIVFAITVVLAVTHHIVIKKFVVSKYAAILVLLSINCIQVLMANVHIGIYMTLFLVPMVSIIYFNRVIYFVACFINFVSTCVIAWTTADYFADRDSVYNGDALGWFTNRMGGYIIESFLMICLGYLVVKVISDSSKKLYISLIENKMDNMTGILNRKAFEEDKAAIKRDVLPKDLVLFYIDINSLKIVNDDKGHMSGDELISGAAICITEVLGQYGKIYRVGGDEFVSIIHTDVPATQLVDALNERVMSWSGKTVDSLKLSIGYSRVADGHAPTFDAMENEAEQMMYADKRRFYSESGFDRRKNRN